MPAPPRTRPTPTPTAMTVALLFGCGFGVNALAASNPVVICDDATRNMQSLAVPVERFSIKVVDHFPANSSADLNQSLDLADADLQIVAPVLSLTPRVATLLDQIFATDSSRSESATTESISPVAERLTKNPELQHDSEVTRSLMQQTTADEELPLPSIQQQMYRKDI